MIQKTNRSHEQGGDVWSVDNTYHYSSPHQAALMQAILDLQIKRCNGLRGLDDTKVQEVVKQAVGYLKMRPDASQIDVDESTMTKVAEYWR